MEDRLREERRKEARGVRRSNRAARSIAAERGKTAFPVKVLAGTTGLSASSCRLRPKKVSSSATRDAPRSFENSESGIVVVAPAFNLHDVAVTCAGPNHPVRMD